MYCVTTLCRLFLLIYISGSACGSGIPMWEYLSRDEKMTHLYNMFTKQVHDYCNNLSMPDCKKVLLVYGLSNLAKMEEDSLDKMDPYQRGATDIIWESMMKGSYKTPGPTTERQDLYATIVQSMEAGYSSGSNTLGSQEEASSHVPHYAEGIGSKIIVGPMVVRLLPNGNPIPGETGIPNLRDEDAEEFKLMRSQPPPSIEEISNKPSNQQASAKFSLDNQHQKGSQNESLIVTST